MRPAACPAVCLGIVLALAGMLVSCAFLPAREEGAERPRTTTARPTYGIGKPAAQHLHTASIPALLPPPVSKTIRISSSTKLPLREILAYYTDPEDGYPGSQAVLDNQYGLISAIAPFWYKLDNRQPGRLIASVSAEHRRQIVANAHQKRLHVYLLVHNLFYGTLTEGKEVARQILRHPNHQQRFLDELEHEMAAYGYDGVNLDMENLYLEDRQAFSQFVKHLSDRLHQSDKRVAVCVAANTGDKRANPWSPWFDYRALGQSADRLVIMTYDEHNPRTAPGAVASYDWTESTIRYALNQGVPSSRILLGVPAYGWDWSSAGGKAKYTSYPMVLSIQQQYRAKPVWDSLSQSPHLSYTDETGANHNVWYENSYSLRFKLQLVERYNLAGIALWRPGLEDPDVWPTIAGKIRVKRFSTR